MKRSVVRFVALLSLLALGAGCAHSARQSARSTVSRPRSFALAVTVNGGLQPTPMQWAAIQAKVADSIAVRGWVLVTDITLADHILRIDFTPNPNDPENSGHARLIGIRRNPRSLVARQGTSPYHTAFGDQYASWPYSGFHSNSFYGYRDYYSDYSGGSSTYVPVTKTPPCPPLRHPPGSEHCPPGESARPLPGQFAGFVSANPIHDHPRPPPSDYGAFSGERSSSRVARSGRSYSSGSSYSSREPSYFSHSDNYSSRSEPSYSYSSSDSYSSSSSSMSSSAAASSAASSASSSDPVVVTNSN